MTNTKHATADATRRAAVGGPVAPASSVYLYGNRRPSNVTVKPNRNDRTDRAIETAPYRFR
jgi:hypothetical protein